MTCDYTRYLICDSVPALACDAPGQGILLRWLANAGTESQVKSQVVTQVDTALYFVRDSVIRHKHFHLKEHVWSLHQLKLLPVGPAGTVGAKVSRVLEPGKLACRSAQRTHVKPTNKRNKVKLQASVPKDLRRC
jgi:hypothetical protein